MRRNMIFPITYPRYNKHLRYIHDDVMNYMTCEPNSIVCDVICPDTIHRIHSYVLM